MLSLRRFFVRLFQTKKRKEKKQSVLDRVVLCTDGVSVWIEEIEPEFWQQERQKHSLS